MNTGGGCSGELAEGENIKRGNPKAASRNPQADVLPALIVIGAMKCATTSLHYYLDLHPQIFMAKRKELDFFVAEKNWHRGIAWYKSQFCGDVEINGESSTSYTKYPTVCDVPERMHRVLPNAKLIYVLRDPIERIISHYVHEYAEGREDRPISEALEVWDGNPYVDTSRYHWQLQQFLECYAREQLLIITAEDLKTDRCTTLRKVFRFLNVDDRFSSPEFGRMLHQSAEKRRKNFVGRLLLQISVRGYRYRVDLPNAGIRLVRALSGPKISRPSIDAELRQRLIEVLRSDVSALRKLTRMEFPYWCL